MNREILLNRLKMRNDRLYRMLEINAPQEILDKEIKLHNEIVTEIINANKNL